MNIFVLDFDPKKSAQMMCDKHVVKMILESAQMLSTAHRVLDGYLYHDKSANGRSIKRWKLQSPYHEDLLYHATHVNHPCNIWTRSSAENYIWLLYHFSFLLAEYTYRYDKIHACEKLVDVLSQTPRCIPQQGLTPFAIAMKHYPECIVEEDAVTSYRNYYKIAKVDFAKWTKRETPDWWISNEW